MPKLKTFREIGQGLTDKVDHHRYDRFYPLFLERFRNQPIRLAEIGVADGGSLHLWTQYLPKAEEIIGLDIEPRPMELPDRAKLLKGDQSTPDGIDAISKAIGSCEVIIDDGSHIPSHQEATFVKLFQENLKPGGVYIIEDIEISYWRPGAYMYGYERGPGSIMALGYHLANLPNQEFGGPANTFGIETVTFAYNCLIITKSQDEDLPMYQRKYRLYENL